jgi:hypothetical protein
MTRWINLGVSGQCGWPDKQIDVVFGDTNFVLMPRIKGKSASIHMQVRSLDQLQEMTTINRFLSVVSWSCKDSLQNDYGWSGNPIPVAVPERNLARSINSFFPIKWDPLPEPKQRLAIALYREAMSVNSAPYQLLGFFKIINILHSRGGDQIAWIEATLPKLASPQARERIAALARSEPKVAQYLYESGRCAVAHAFSDPLIDPDDLAHIRRLSADLDVAQALAEYLIANELHVPQYP